MGGWKALILGLPTMPSLHVDVVALEAVTKADVDPGLVGLLLAS